MTLRKRTFRRSLAVLLAVVFLVASSHAGSHGHQDLGEHPQICALCQVSNQARQFAVAPDLEAPLPAITIELSGDTPDLPSVPLRLRSRFSRAPPA